LHGISAFRRRRPARLGEQHFAPERIPINKRNWLDLTSEDFPRLDPARTVAIMPVAAVEQHGPHLPVATDTAIAEGMVAEVKQRLPYELPALFLPVQAVGRSNEHIRSAGTLTYTAETVLRAWTEIGESVAWAGVRKLVLVNSHGGNVEILGIVARELRIRCQMLCVPTQWRRLGLPEGMFDSVETAHGIHAGDIETSLMLHFRPELVKMDRAENFVSSAVALERENAFLRPTGPAAPFGWIAPDLNPQGAVGDASKATADKGRAVAAHQAERFVQLLGEVSAFDLSRLA
jgi:creatinine amidohydrolase